MTTAKTQPKLSREEQSFAYLGIGFVVGLTPILAPVHEFFHVIGYALSGVEASITGWAETTAEYYTVMGLYSGPFGEVVILGFLGYLLVWRGRVKAWFWIGYAFSSFLTAIGSLDLGEYAVYAFGSANAELYRKTFIIVALTFHLLMIFRSIQVHVERQHEKKAPA